MGFQFFTNMLSLASRRVAGWVLSVGLFLILFGLLIIAYSKFFAFVAAIFFFIAGGSLVVTAIKILLAQHKLRKTFEQSSEAYRENVRIHIEE